MWLRFYLLVTAVLCSRTPYASLNVTGTIPRQSTPGVIPSPPTSNPPPIPLDDFLKRIALGHCASKLHMAGVQTVAELMRLSHIDLLSYGLIAEEAQRIRDAFSRYFVILIFLPVIFLLDQWVIVV